jgi:hypothetical protein
MQKSTSRKEEDLVEELTTPVVLWMVIFGCPVGMEGLTSMNCTIIKSALDLLMHESQFFLEEE